VFGCWFSNAIYATKYSHIGPMNHFFEPSLSARAGAYYLRRPKAEHYTERHRCRTRARSEVCPSGGTQSRPGSADSLGSHFTTTLTQVRMHTTMKSAAYTEIRLSQRTRKQRKRTQANVRSTSHRSL